MKIDKIHIENFGKLSNFTLDFKEGLNELYEVNGYGKTTLSVFIKSIFYGMPPARENLKMDRKKYMPWQGGSFGGYIEFSTSQERFRLTRFFGKTPESDTFELLNLNTNQLIDNPKNEIGEILFGVGKDTFEMTSFFPQNNFLSYANNQMSANILGLDRLKFDLANVNLAIDKIKKKESEIKKLKPTKEEINRKQSSLLELKNELSSLQNSLNESQKEIELLKKTFLNKQEQFETLQKQHEIQDDLLATKDKIEKELLSLSSQLNLLHLEQETINNSRQNMATKQPKNLKFWQYETLISSVLIIIATVLLAVFDVLSSLVTILTSIGVLVTALVLFVYFHKKTKAGKSIKEQMTQLDKESVEISHKIFVVRDAINQAENNLKVYKDISKNDELYYSSKEELIRLSSQLERLTLNQDNDNRELDGLIDNIDNLKSDINTLELRSEEIVKKQNVLNKTKELLLQANQNVSMRFVEPVNSAMSDIIKHFELKNRDFIVDTNFDIKEMTDKGVKELDYSSQGIKDILSFCMRVYFIKEIYKEEKPIIILDDTFVNLDDENMKKVGEIVNKLAQEYQILYLYCHERCKIKTPNI